MSDAVSAGIGAAIGSVVLAGTTWWVTSRLNRQTECRSLLGALDVVIAELKDNELRIDSIESDRASDVTREPVSESNASDECGESNQRKGPNAQYRWRELTLGDWAGSKPALAGLAVEDEALWTKTCELYTDIYEARSGRPERIKAAVASGQLPTVRDDLLAKREKVRGELVWAGLPRRLASWFSR
jgi:hypothetical protein